ncbi:hypothetical protein [Aneurinibacillus sp. REN35]|uniref:hypothetical protein n=1 Tax=Aneurinibacillus sp. REN35 TaxID=3237286 RepID=UPI003528E805
MPCTRGDKGRNMGQTNNKQKTEIQDEIIDEIANINDIRRTKNSIYTSTNFHLDAVELKDSYKVEIQFKGGTKQTVSVIDVSDAATSTADVKTALTNSLNDGYKWLVT